MTFARENGNLLNSVTNYPFRSSLPPPLPPMPMSRMCPLSFSLSLSLSLSLFRFLRLSVCFSPKSRGFEQASRNSALIWD